MSLANPVRGDGVTSFSMFKIAVSLCAAAAIAGCQTTDVMVADTSQGKTLDEYAYGTLEPLDTKYYASDEPVQKGFRHFYSGDFGNAQKYFQEAVEKTPRDATAWVGLAASYDRLRRFDLADEAYAQAISLGGESIQILNNQGYSYLLRGDFDNARSKFLKAYEIDPTDPTIKNNLVLLSTSWRKVERDPGAY